MQNEPCQSHLFTLCMHYNSILGVTCEHGSSAHSCWISLFRRRLLSGRWGHRCLGYAPRRLPVASRVAYYCFYFRCVICLFGLRPICVKLWIIIVINWMRDMFVISFLDCVHWKSWTSVWTQRIRDPSFPGSTIDELPINVKSDSEHIKIVHTGTLTTHEESNKNPNLSPKEN